jgi:hypothetical protein
MVGSPNFEPASAMAWSSASRSLEPHPQAADLPTRAGAAARAGGARQGEDRGPSAAEFQAKQGANLRWRRTTSNRSARQLPRARAGGDENSQQQKRGLLSPPVGVGARGGI